MIGKKLKLLQATVISKSGAKTVLAELSSIVVHSKYQKVIKKTKKIMVHDEHDLSKVGQYIFVLSTRLKSSRKSWKLFKNSSSFDISKKGVMNDSK